MKYDPKVHQRKSIRLKNYDYSQGGAYFITICCEDKKCLFGKVVDGAMVLNDAGKIAFDEWVKTSQLRKNIVIDSFVVMPNHIHGIIIIRTQSDINSVGADCIRPNSTNINEFDVVKKGECNSPLRGTSQTIGAIVRGYKSAVTKRINFSKSIWQRNYYEHIIRTENSYQLIADYILMNPANWLQDKLYTQ